MRNMLDYGPSATGLVPTFVVFRDLQTSVNLTPPAVVEIGNGQYYFDYTANKDDIVFAVQAAGQQLTGVLSGTGINWRHVLYFGMTNTGLTPTFTLFRNLDTLAAITPPTCTEIGFGLYYFDTVFALGTSPAAISYSATAAGVNVSGVISLPLAYYQTSGGATTLAALRLRAQQEADMENDPHISTDEWNVMLNASRLELYDMLVTRFGEDYYIANAVITTDGINDLFPLPDGTLYSNALPYYKGDLVESQVYGGPTGWVSLQKFNLHEKNKFRLLNYYTIMAQRLPRYRIVGPNLMLAPLPVSGIQVRVWYAPKLTPLVYDTDIAEDWSGWLEYVVVDAAIKALGKQERDASLLLARKQALKERIEAASQNRDLGEPNTVTEVQTDTFPFGAPFSIFGTGPWGGV